MLFHFLRNKLCLILIAACAIPAFAKTPPLRNVPIEDVSFLGRKGELVELKEKLTQGPVIVTGVSGVGKSHLTFAYARKNASKYRVVWVFDASKGVDEQMMDFANKLYALTHNGQQGHFSKKEEASHYVKTLLRTCSFAWLLIFDNALGFSSVKAALPETHGEKGKHVLVSSLSERGATGVLRVEAMTDGEAKTFLRHYLKNASDDEIQHLARLLENHPLALLQAASYINATPNMSVDAYISFFTQNKRDYWESEAKALQGQPLLSTAIKISIDKLKSASPDDYTVLVALSMLNTAKIESSLIEKVFARLGDGAVAGFGRIQDVALISPLGDKTYKIHDYVRDVVLTGADQETLSKAANLNAQALLSLFPKKIEQCTGIFETNPDLYTHMKSLTGYIDDMSPSNAVEIVIRTLYFSEVIVRDYGYADRHCEKIKKLFDSGLITDPTITGVFYSYYGNAVLTHGTVREALVQSKRAYDAFKKANIEDVRHPLILLLCDNLGFYHHWMGDIKAAQHYLDEAKALYEGQNDLLLEAAIKELDVILKQDRGNFEESFRIANKLSEDLEKDPSMNKMAGHFVKSLMACSLLKIADIKSIDKKYKEAEKLRKEAYEISRNAYARALRSSDGHEDKEIIGRTLVYLSQSQSAMNMHKEAEKSALKAIKILDDDLGRSKVIRRQGVAHIALADAYMGQKRYKEAVKEYLFAEDIFVHISSHLSFDDMSELYHKMVIAYIAQNDQMNVRRYALKHQKSFPIDHPRFIDIRNREDAPF
ncbi:MAG: hypothetical protein C0514_09110 [Candidatus Puniceispirillum sp.]|nr:hypothetical protein [Candidatus Puniceispirillum sp.]